MVVWVGPREGGESQWGSSEAGPTSQVGNNSLKYETPMMDLFLAWYDFQGKRLQRVTPMDENLGC